MSVDVNDFERELECDYKSEHYSVRDNGARQEQHIDVTPESISNISDPIEADIIGEWVFRSPNPNNKSHYIKQDVIESNDEYKYMPSLTPNAVQRIIFIDDKPNSYPCTPLTFTGDPLEAYKKRLVLGAEFFRNHNGAYLVVKAEYAKDKQSIYILTRAGYIYNSSGTPIAVDENYDCEELVHALSIVSYKDGVFRHDRAEPGFHPTEELENMYKEYTL